MPSQSIVFDNCENLWGMTVTIAAATGLAEAVNTQGQALIGILMPAGWTAAKIGYDVSVDGATYRTAYDNGGNFEQTVAEASAYIAIPQSDTIFAPMIRLKSVDATNVAVPQAGDRALTLVFRRYLGGS